MESDIASTIAFMNFHAPLGEEFGRSDNILGFSVATKSDNRGVLQKKEYIADAALFAKRHQLFLQAEAGRVIERADLENRDQRLSHGFYGSTRIQNHFTTEDTEFTEVL